MCYIGCLYLKLYLNYAKSQYKKAVLSFFWDNTQRQYEFVVYSAVFNIELFITYLFPVFVMLCDSGNDLVQTATLQNI